MVRLALADEQKRKQVAVRLSPRDRERIGKIAEANGNSLGAEVEQLALDQLEYLEGQDAQTRALLEAIADEIAAIKKATGKNWHKDRASWAAVAEMLRNGPIAELDPDKPSDDEVVAGAWEALSKIETRKKQIAETLRDLGVTVSPDHPTKRQPRRQGLLGMLGQVNALPLAPITIRTTERAAINALPEGPAKEEALRLFGEMEALDHEEAEASAKHTEAMAPYWEAVANGRTVYRTILKQRAQQRQAEGKDFNYRHLLGWFFDGA